MYKIEELKESLRRMLFDAKNRIAGGTDLCEEVTGLLEHYYQWSKCHGPRNGAPIVMRPERELLALIFVHRDWAKVDPLQQAYLMKQAGYYQLTTGEHVGEGYDLMMCSFGLLGLAALESPYEAGEREALIAQTGSMTLRSIIRSLQSQETCDLLTETGRGSVVSRQSILTLFEMCRRYVKFSGDSYLLCAVRLDELKFRIRDRTPTYDDLRKARQAEADTVQEEEWRDRGFPDEHVHNALAGDILQIALDVDPQSFPDGVSRESVANEVVAHAKAVVDLSDGPYNEAYIRTSYAIALSRIGRFNDAREQATLAWTRWQESTRSDAADAQIQRLTEIPDWEVPS